MEGRGGRGSGMRRFSLLEGVERGGGGGNGEGGGLGLGLGEWLLG